MATRVFVLVLGQQTPISACGPAVYALLRVPANFPVLDIVVGLQVGVRGRACNRRRREGFVGGGGNHDPTRMALHRISMKCLATGMHVTPSIGLVPDRFAPVHGGGRVGTAQLHTVSFFGFRLEITLANFDHTIVFISIVGFDAETFLFGTELDGGGFFDVQIEVVTRTVARPNDTAALQLAIPGLVSAATTAVVDTVFKGDASGGAVAQKSTLLNGFGVDRIAVQSDVVAVDTFFGVLGVVKGG